MEKVDFHSTGKVWENKHFKFMGFLNNSDEVEIHTIPKIWEKWIPIIWENYGKKQKFQSNGFLKYFGWSRNPYNSQYIEKVNPHSKGNIWENTNISKVKCFWNFCAWNRNPCSSQNIEKLDFHYTGKIWENTNIPKCWISQIFWVKQKSIEFPKYGISEFP